LSCLHPIYTFHVQGHSYVTRVEMSREIALVMHFDMHLENMHSMS
jgi:hypothetical protein